jgi:ferredoxin
MTYVVTENCINCKHTTCVEVCPTDAFREGPNFLVIDPEACVDCDLCPAECPIGAIYKEEYVHEDQQHFIQINAELAQLWPEITREKAPLPDHEKWDNVEGKLEFLLR